MLEKKQILIGGLIGGLMLWLVPGIFLPDSMELIDYALKGMAGVMMLGAVVYFIAGDVIMSGGSSSGVKYDKQVRNMIKQGLITPEQAFEKQQEIYAQELQLAKAKLLLEQQKVEMAKQQAAIKKHKQTSGGQGMGALTGGSSNGKKESAKFPDILGNLGPMMSGEPQTKKSKKEQDDKEDDLRNLF